MDNTQLLQAIKRAAYLAPAGPQYGDSAIFAEADDVINDFMVPMLVQSSSITFLVHTYVTPVVGGTSRYPIPVGVGDSIIDLHYQDTNGNIVPIPITDSADRSFHSQLSAPIGPQTAAYIDGDAVVIVPTPSSSASSGSLVMKWPVRPNKLIDPAAALTIVSGTGPVFTVSADPSTLGMGAGSRVDIIAATSPFMHRAISALVTASTVNTITLSYLTTITDQGFGVNPGDYIAVAGYSPVAQIPLDQHSSLAKLTGARLLRYMGDPRADQVEAESLKLFSRVTSLIASRTRKQKQTIKNRFSALRSSRGRFPSRW